LYHSQKITFTQTSTTVSNCRLNTDKIIEPIKLNNNKKYIILREPIKFVKNPIDGTPPS
jgi:hypothetical protein